MGTLYPIKQGLYDPSNEKDSCGVGAIADVRGHVSHEIVADGLSILKKMKHRGAVGSDATTGDGAGIMTGIPHQYFESELHNQGISLPNKGQYAVGMVFLPRVPHAKLYFEGLLEQVIEEEGLRVIGWRSVPVNVYECGQSARATRPEIAQLFVDSCGLSRSAFERQLLIVRKRVEAVALSSNVVNSEIFYICSLSASTIVYKGQILGYKLDDYYSDLKNEKYKSNMAIVHERYSTNTFPSWKLAQPFRYTAHNGEFNTIRGNRNWMNAREGVMYSGIFADDFKKILPVIEDEGSDSSSFDNVLELFLANNHEMTYTLSMMIPEPWQNDRSMNESLKAFYEYHARIMEPWDGPAALICSDGKTLTAKLDRNGLRPSRYAVTESGKLIIASETGVFDTKDQVIIRNGALSPGEILSIDLNSGEIKSDKEIKEELVAYKDYENWVASNRMTLEDIKGNYEIKKSRIETRQIKEKVFAYTDKEKKQIIGHMARTCKEAIGSMGIDEPIAILSDQNNLLYDYFRQEFAQVTNPPIDPFRERSVVSLRQFIGSHGRQLDQVEIKDHVQYLMIKSPVLSSPELEDIKHIENPHFKPVTLPILLEKDQESALEKALKRLCERAEDLVKSGYNILILSDRGVDYYNVPIPSLLALGAVHHHLLNKKLRTAVDIIMETGEARDVMHIALLVAYGAKAINPYMVYEFLLDNKDTSLAFENYKQAIDEGMLKIISRMGISTLPSYNGAQIFEALGIHESVVSRYFTGTPSRIGGIDLEKIESDVLERHHHAYENHQETKAKTNKMFPPKLVEKLTSACQSGDSVSYATYNKSIGNQKILLRDYFTFKNTEAIDIEEVEPVENIIKRFTVAGMSFGSLSQEAHETIAIAMNRLGVSSNSGEGGEDKKRYQLNKRGDNLLSQVKQVASSRFGVDTDYLINCQEIQIKIAQGAKPGEGGHLPGSKVTEDISKIRYAQRGKDLISPPPHHDIYSIEDLAQLIFDMKNVNPEARVGVKLVAGHGVGTVASGAAKAYADVITISGFDGGTGASPISSMKYVGLPWEIGLADTQQTLLLNDLRKRVRLQVDGKLRNGKDVIIAALLGAEEFGFGTLALVALGCKMCRQCHLGLCPAGIATQDESKRKNFMGRPEDLMNLMRFIGGEVRQYMAQLGFKNFDDLIGKVEYLKLDQDIESYAKYIDFSPILHKPLLPSRINRRQVELQAHKTHGVLDKILIQEIDSLPKGTDYKKTLDIHNTDRSFGTMLSGYLAKSAFKNKVHLITKGTAGQSYGAFARENMQFDMTGDCNDYVGKGLSGGLISIKAPSTFTVNDACNTLVGNTVLYGATSGRLYIAGKAGQRFAVRNSGATAVVEGIGNHGCEYMTGGKVLILGDVGDNFAAGMTGGSAYVLDPNNVLKDKCNLTHVQVSDKLRKNDIKDISHLLQEHVAFTYSKEGQAILESLDDQLKYFKKVHPK